MADISHGGGMSSALNVINACKQVRLNGLGYPQ